LTVVVAAIVIAELNPAPIRESANPPAFVAAIRIEGGRYARRMIRASSGFVRRFFTSEEYKIWPTKSISEQ
jgi:hypothetical protein